MSRWNIDDKFWNDETPQDGPHRSTQQQHHSNAFSSKGPLCPNCGSHSIESLGPSGASVCTDCGILVEENALVSSVEFSEGAGGTSTMVGQFVGSNSRGLNRGGQYGFSRQSRENTLASGKRSIQDVAALLRLGNQFVDAAH